MPSNGKQFTVTREILTAVVRDQRWPDVIAGISARFQKFALVLSSYTTNHLMIDPEGNSEFCFPRISMVEGNIEIRGKQNSLFPLGPAKHSILLALVDLYSGY